MSHFRPGDRICGRFAVEAQIGVGGMSEVYRGRDEKLHGRVVAIKVLRASPLEGSEPRSIQAEARSLSALNHPNIAVLYDVCSHEGLDVLVMELVEGETLASKLRDTRLSEADAMKYAVQITDGLAYAHHHRVVHRDVKPANIMITSRGAKLLDFGLARLLRPATVAVGDPGGDEHLVAGTPFYMSPEQSARLTVDERTDIYSVGLVMCQMLTGFSPDATSGLPPRTLIAGLLEQITSRPLRRIIERCLQTNPDDRWMHARDLHHALVAVSDITAPTAPVREDVRRNMAAPVVAVGLVVALAAGFAWWASRSRAPVNEYQFAIAPRPGTHFVSLETGGPAAISPDGRTVAFVAADQGGVTRLWTRPLNAIEAAPLYGTEGASHPFWSPDSRFIAFFTPGALQRIAATGGSVRTITKAPQGRGGSWSVDGVIVFAPGFTERLYRVSPEGGDAEPVTALDYARRETSHRWPVFLPDGRHFLFFVRSDRPEVLGLYVGTLDQPQRTRIAQISSSAVFAESNGQGYLVFSQEGFLTAQRFAPSEGRLSGALYRIAPVPPPEEDTSVAPVTVSNTGVLLQSGGSSFRQPLTWVDRSGHDLGATVAQGQYRNPRLSPDGRRVALERLDLRTGLGNVWIFDLERNVQQRFDLEPAASYSPVWSPAGNSLLFSSYRGAQWDLVQRNEASDADVEVLRTAPVSNTTERLAQAATDWSRDGKWVIYQERVPGNQWDLGALEVQTGRTRSLAASQHNEYQGQLSPDGSWVVYTSNESGRDEVYLHGFPSMAPRFRVSTAGGSQPKWRGDGRELFYVDPNLGMMSVDVDVGSHPPKLGASRMLFRAGMAPAAGLVFVSNYDVHRTGERFLVAGPPEAQNIHQLLTVIVNWLAEIPDE